MSSRCEADLVEACRNVDRRVCTGQRGAGPFSPRRVRKGFSPMCSDGPVLRARLDSLSYPADARGQGPGTRSHRGRSGLVLRPTACALSTARFSTSRRWTSDEPRARLASVGRNRPRRRCRGLADGAAAA